MRRWVLSAGLMAAGFDVADPARGEVLCLQSGSQLYSERPSCEVIDGAARLSTATISSLMRRSYFGRSKSVRAQAVRKRSGLGPALLSVVGIVRTASGRENSQAVVVSRFSCQERFQVVFGD
jgi:hypothetical protein